MPIKDKSPQSKTTSRSPQSTPKTTEAKKKSGPIRQSASGSGGINGNSSWTSAQRDSSNVSKEAQKTENSNGSIGSLISGLGEWSGSQSSGETNQPALNLSENELLGTGRNSSPEQVTQLQEMLRSQGVQLEVDGKYGPLTEQAVRDFQTENGLKVDGIVGPETQGALNGGNQRTEAPETEQRPPAAPGELGQLELADPNASPAEQYEHYRALIEANGGEISADGATVVGMRGLGTDGQRHDGTSNVGGYDDTFVVLNRDANGNPTVELFRGATHANQRSSSGSFGPDANGNNVRGVAMLAPGNYSVDPHSRNYRGNRGPSFHVKTQDGQGYVPAFRDLNADGTISASERAQAEQGGYQASAILFHAGRGDAPSSIGCQTMPPELMRAFSDAVGFNGFNYTLLDANSSRLPA